MNKIETVLSQEQLKEFEKDMNAIQDKYGVDLMAIIETSNQGIIPRIAIVSRPKQPKEAVEPATVVEEGSEDVAVDASAE